MIPCGSPDKTPQQIIKEIPRIDLITAMRGIV